MALRSPEGLVVGLFDRGAIGYAESDDPELVDQPHGFVKLRSGRLSPVFVNLRGLSSFPSNIDNITLGKQIRLREDVIAAFSETIDAINDFKKPEHQHLMGLPLAVAGLAAMIGYKRVESVLIMRTETKVGSKHKMIEGDHKPGDIVLGLDDVITDGKVKLETVEKIIAQSLVMKKFAILVDRQEGGVQDVESSGINVYSALNIGIITAILNANNRIGYKQVEWTTEYFQKLVDKQIIAQIPAEIVSLI